MGVGSGVFVHKKARTMSCSSRIIELESCVVKKKKVVGIVSEKYFLGGVVAALWWFQCDVSLGTEFSVRCFISDRLLGG